MINPFLFLSILLSMFNPKVTPGDLSVSNTDYVYTVEDTKSFLATKSISLEERYNEKSVNDVFKDNILLTLYYLEEDIKNKADIDWETIGEPKQFEFSLNPDEGFAFHDQILPSFEKNVVKTTNAHFNFQDGFKSDGYLTGDGVCHLASLMYWAAKDAGLDASSPVSHDFTKINEIPKEYGVSIYSLPGAFDLSARQNLYITNNLDKGVTFSFNYDGTNLTIVITKSIS
jgi:hypothetical protein